jgi:DNA-binding IclR family transcriptional regulator
MDRTSPEEKNPVVKSVGRVIEVFELLRDMRRPLTGTEIGRTLKYPKSSTNAILKSLVALGYLSLDRQNLTYFPSLRLTQLADWVPAALLGSGEAANLLDELHEATSETVTLSMQNDLYVELLRLIPGTFPISLRVREGYVVPLFGTGIGTALLATMSDDEISALGERFNLQARRRRDRLDVLTVLEEVHKVRKSGYAAAYDRLIADTGAVAMALPRSLEGRQLVLAVAGLGDRIHRNEAVIIRTMRRAISRYYANSRRN